MELDELLTTYKKAKENQGRRDYDKVLNKKNKSCGDEVSLFIKMEKNVLTNISYEAKGCAVCLSSAYLLSENLKNIEVNKIKEMTPDDYLKLIGFLNLSLSRRKCALTAFFSLKEGLKDL